ncbi:MAG: chromosomal replication initiator protein DnaA [Kiritimatiellia bacterium]
MDTVNSNSLWQQACEHLRDALHADVYSRWISVISPVRAEQDTLYLAVDNDFYQSWLEEHYLPLICDALRAVSGQDWKIAFTVNPVDLFSFSETAVQPKSEASRTLRERLLPRRHETRLQLNPKYTMSTFVVGPANSFAHAAALAVSEAPAKAYNPLFIYGGTGLGKTHLMQAIGHAVLENNRARNICYVTCETLLNEYIDALQKRSITEFRKRYRTVDLLLIDDIHFLSGKERIQEEFFHTFNSLFDAHKQIIMTSDRPASEINGLEQRLVSRFEWGLVTELERPDFETRMAILRFKQREMKLSVDEGVLNFIAENVRSNVRRLEGALVRAVSFMSLTQQPLSLEALKRLLRDTIEQEEQAALSLSDIQKAVAAHYDIRLADMSSTARPRSIAVPRQVAMYLCRSLTPSSLPDIGTAFNKTHATVMHACTTIQNRMDVDQDLRRQVQDISTKLGKNIHASATAL